MYSSIYSTHPSVTSIGDLYALVGFFGQIIRPIRKSVMAAEGRRMKARSTATSEKRMLGAV